jgi:periplasmic glucans biosynthesis protein
MEGTQHCTASGLAPTLCRGRWLRRAAARTCALVLPLWLTAAHSAIPAAAPPTAAPIPDTTERSFTFEDVRRLAAQRVKQPYRLPAEALPEVLTNLSYEQYRSIRFRPASALWHGRSLFEVQFFHRGFQNRQRVNIFEVGAAGVVPLLYNPAYFTFGSFAKPPKLPLTLGFAGFRVHFPLQSPAYKDELLSFLGASYFRVLGRNQHYGASARGLAIDTAAQSGEEFPVFTDFWLVQPAAMDRVLTVYALLDSRSAVGAYQFDVHPGTMSQVEVHCSLFLRRAIGKLGMAPLTSMFLFGTDTPNRRGDDFRPQVHDSDGLMLQTGQGQWIWRPLVNPRELRVNRFMDENPRGFGLFQRERDFGQYQDVTAEYEARPSYWVQPLGSWGKGGVELIEIPSEEEIHDNVVAYWVPTEAPSTARPLNFAYLISAFTHMTQWPPGGSVVATRSGNPTNAESPTRFAPGARRILADFTGGDLDSLGAAQPVRAEVTADNGHIETLNVERTAAGTWRVAMVITPRAKRPVELHCFLTLYGEILTETWVYQWTP